MSANTIFNVQALRAVAAIIVVFYHLQPIINDAYATTMHSLYGAYGVDIFFVISGFIMFYTNRTFKKSPGSFMVNRLWRIVPLYWAATFFVVSFYLIGFHPNGLQYLDAKMLATSLIFIPSEFPGERHDLVLSLGWTLMYELFFYLAFAATFALRSLERSFVVLTVGFLALILSGYLLSAPTHLVAFFQRPILIEFLFGAALAILLIRHPDRPAMRSAGLGYALLAAGFLVPFPITAIFGEASVELDGLRFLLLGVPALAVVGGALILENSGRRVENRVVLLLGAASYALYLFHPALIQGTVKILAAILKDPNAFAIAAAVVLPMIVACIGAIAIHLVVERRILDFSHRMTAPRARLGTPAETRSS